MAESRDGRSRPDDSDENGASEVGIRREALQKPLARLMELFKMLRRVASSRAEELINARKDARSAEEERRAKLIKRLR